MEKATLAAGCFWGVEHLFTQLDGVLLAESGYTGGDVNAPSYDTVCRGDSGHVEAVRIVFDKTVLSYEAVYRYFFEIHHFDFFLLFVDEAY